MVLSQRFNILVHLAGWFLFNAMVLSFVSLQPNDGGIAKHILNPWFLFFCFILPALFYINLLVLMPLLMNKGKYVLYVAIFLLCLLLMLWLKPFDHLMFAQQMPSKQSLPPPDMYPYPPLQPAPNKKPQFDMMSLILFVLVWLLSLAVYVFQQWRISQQRALQAEADKANAELSFLKAQVNPHFLFNTLNNIYTLALMKSEHTADSVMKLSNIMRYVTDDATATMVSLETELACLHDYIDLQKLRLSKNTFVDIRVTGNTAGKTIAPMLLLPFVENAFKYGVSSHELSEIIIHFRADEKQLYFTCTNRNFETRNLVERTGIGQANTIKRLQHLYVNRHRLNLKTDNGLYIVELILDI